MEVEEGMGEAHGGVVFAGVSYDMRGGWRRDAMGGGRSRDGNGGGGWGVGVGGGGLTLVYLGVCLALPCW